jgi:hypothetical protein
MNIKVNARENVTNLVDLNSLRVGEPFGACLTDVSGLHVSPFLRDQDADSRVYAFMTLPGSDGIYRVQATAKGITFMDLTMCGTDFPAFTKVFGNTDYTLTHYDKLHAEYPTMEGRVYSLLENFAKIQQLEGVPA